MLQLTDLPKRFLEDKKGFAISYKMIMWIPRFFFTIVVISVTSYIILAFIVTKTNVAEQESNILIDAAHFSKGGFSAFDKVTGRVYPGVIDSLDSSRFSTAQLGQLFASDNPPLTAGRFVKKQVIVDYFLGPQADADNHIAYTDKTRYLRWQPIARANAKGEGGKKPYSELRYVALKDGGGAILETVFIASN